MSDILIGTTKGAFVATPDGAVTGPFCDGWPINHFASDPATNVIWAAGGGDWDGAGVWRRRDGEWQLSLLANGQRDAWMASDPDMADTLGMTAAPPAPFTDQINALWSLKRLGTALYAGAKPAALYVSHDDGESWAVVQGLSDHPSGDSWQPGAAGLTLHTIVADAGDPAKIWIGISAAGVFATEDGGLTWDRRNRLSNAIAPGTHSHPAAPCGHETGLCVHNMVQAGRDVLYQQNHHGTYRSRDGGRSWDDITGGLPSTFGFPVACLPDDPETVFVIPLNGDSAGRYPPDGAPAVWRSRDAGESWTALRNGLPERAYFTVLRQAMAVDDAGGVYFGTNSGSVFHSQDSGETWGEVVRHLPTILCVETL